MPQTSLMLDRWHDVILLRKHFDYLNQTGAQSLNFSFGLICNAYSCEWLIHLIFVLSWTHWRINPRES